MVVARWFACAMIGVAVLGATGCSGTRGCCHKQPVAVGPECCPPGPVIPGGPVAAPPPPTQAFSVGPTCAVPMP